jgi:hypothetical protein
MKSVNSIELLLSDARGQYIPRDFVEGFDLSLWSGINSDDIEICKDPENEWYWDAWEQIVSKAEFHKDGHVWRLHQGGDLWAYCYELMTEDEKGNWGFND